MQIKYESIFRSNFNYNNCININRNNGLVGFTMSGPLTEEQANRVIKRSRCHSPDCPFSDKEHKIFEEHEKAKMMGKQTYYMFEPPASILTNEKDLQIKRTFLDEYGNKTFLMEKKLE